MNRPSESSAGSPVSYGRATCQAVQVATIEKTAAIALKDIVQQGPRADWMRKFCKGLADALGAVSVMLLRCHPDGTLDVQSTSRESALWAELVRLPERADGTFAGNGPAGRAAQQRAAQIVMLDDEGFLPWRAAARADGITAISAAPLEGVTEPWYLLVCTSDVGTLTSDLFKRACSGCARVLVADADFRCGSQSRPRPPDETSGIDVHQRHRRLGAKRSCGVPIPGTGEPVRDAEKSASTSTANLRSSDAFFGRQTRATLTAPLALFLP